MKINQIVSENAIVEGINHPALRGWDEMDANQKRAALNKAGYGDSLPTGSLSSVWLDNFLHQQKLDAQEKEHDLNIGVDERRELQRKADELREIKRQQLRKERLEDEELAYVRAKDKAEREAEMEKIKRKYEHDLTVIDKEHRNNMEAIKTGNAHEINKMDKEHQHEKEMFDREAAEKDKDRVKAEPQKPQQPVEPPEPEEEPVQRPRPQGPTPWHTSQQVGYTPTKPNKPQKDDSDVIDVVARPVKDKDEPQGTLQLGYTKESIDRIIQLAGIKK